MRTDEVKVSVSESLANIIDTWIWVKSLNEGMKVSFWYVNLDFIHICNLEIN